MKTNPIKTNSKFTGSGILKRSFKVVSKTPKSGRPTLKLFKRDHSLLWSHRSFIKDHKEASALQAHRGQQLFDSGPS
jgi:hypothetical protein